jgi:hypothetical protein
VATSSWGASDPEVADSSLHPESIERSVVQIPTARPEIAEVLPTLTVQRHYLAVQDRFLDRQLLPAPAAEVLESLELNSGEGPADSWAEAGSQAA